MTTPSDVTKGFFPVQTRVSKGRNPELFEHLLREAQNGESPGAVLRRLAEEALMLRNHPLTRALQAIDFTGQSRQPFQTMAPTSLEQKNETFHTSDSSVSKDTNAKEGSKTGSRAPVSGSQQMASILAGRTSAAATPRG